MNESQLRLTLFVIVLIIAQASLPQYPYGENMIAQLPDFDLIFPELSVLVMGCITLLVSLYLPSKASHWVYRLAQFTVVTAFVMTGILLFQHDFSASGDRIFYNMIVVDKLACILKLAICAITFAVLMYGRDYVRGRGISRGEYYSLSLFSMLGMMVLVSSTHLLTLFLALELLSLPIYALVAVFRDSTTCTEAAIKYFVMGALATGILLYGFSILYGVTGSLDFSEIATSLASILPEKNVLAVFGLVFAIVGMAFKLGIAPFHMWVPDVYEGAPTSVTLFIATAPKIAVFGMLIRLLEGAMPSLSIHSQELLILLSVLSIAIGNLIAVVQTNIRRLLAYSSIAHMGYMILGVIAMTSMGYAAAMFYIFTYVLTSLALFGFVLMMGTQEQELMWINGLRGLNQRNPWLAFMALITLFAMAGVPPVVGFMAKLGVLEALINVHLTSLAVFAMLFAVVGVYYYVRIVKVMYFDEPDNTVPVLYSRGSAVLLSVNCIAILALGFFPSGLFQLCQSVFI